MTIFRTGCGGGVLAWHGRLRVAGMGYRMRLDHQAGDGGGRRRSSPGGDGGGPAARQAGGAGSSSPRSPARSAAATPSPQAPYPNRDGKARLVRPGKINDPERTGYPACQRPLHPLVPRRGKAPARVRGISLASHLDDRRVASRMAAAGRTVLGAADITAQIQERSDSTAAQHGAAFALFADFIGGTRLGADRAGAPGRPAGRIGARVARQRPGHSVRRPRRRDQQLPSALPHRAHRDGRVAGPAVPRRRGPCHRQHPGRPRPGCPEPAHGHMRGRRPADARTQLPALGVSPAWPVLEPSGPAYWDHCL